MRCTITRFEMAVIPPGKWSTEPANHLPSPGPRRGPRRPRREPRRSNTTGPCSGGATRSHSGGAAGDERRRQGPPARAAEHTENRGHGEGPRNPGEARGKRVRETGGHWHYFSESSSSPRHHKECDVSRRHFKNFASVYCSLSTAHKCRHFRQCNIQDLKLPKPRSKRVSFQQQ
jgi:hypothetical protein